MSHQIRHQGVLCALRLLGLSLRFASSSFSAQNLLPALLRLSHKTLRSRFEETKRPFHAYHTEVGAMSSDEDGKNSLVGGRMSPTVSSRGGGSEPRSEEPTMR